MATVTTTERVCDGVKGRPCGKPLRTRRDGLVIYGQVYAAGPDLTKCELLVGFEFGARSSHHESKVEICWSCWHQYVDDPLYREAIADNERHSRQATTYNGDEDDASRPISGPLDPPELPRAVRFAKTLADVPEKG